MAYHLKAQNLTIDVPNAGCDKNCPYCISRMTGYVDQNLDLMLRNVDTVKRVASIAEVSSVLMTGKGEPLLAFDTLCRLAAHFSDWPLELQTNGLKLVEEESSSLLDSLREVGFNVIALSVDSPEQFKAFGDQLISHIKYRGMLVRLTVNISDLLDEYQEYEKVIQFAIDHKVDHLTFRRLTIPENPQDEEVVEWIREHTPQDHHYDTFKSSLTDYYNKHGRLIQTMVDGTVLYDIEGVSVAHSDYCIQEQNKGTDIRSLIFKADGHLYTSWNSNAAKII